MRGHTWVWHRTAALEAATISGQERREILEPRTKTEGRRRNENPFDGANTPSDQRVTCPAFEVQKGTRLALPGPPNASIHPDPSRHGPRLQAGQHCGPRARPSAPGRGSFPRAPAPGGGAGLGRGSGTFHNSDCFLRRRVHAGPRG